MSLEAAAAHSMMTFGLGVVVRTICPEEGRLYEKKTSEFYVQDKARLFNDSINIWFVLLHLKLCM